MEQEYGFDRAVPLSATGEPGSYDAHLPESWTVHGGPVNGGVTLGPARVQTEAIRGARSSRPARPASPSATRTASRSSASARWRLSRIRLRAWHMRAWFRLRDGQEPAALMLVQVVDALPPVAYDLGVSGWVPTHEVTVHVRARPAPGWLRISTSSVDFAGGFLGGGRRDLGLGGPARRPGPAVGESRRNAVDARRLRLGRLVTRRPPRTLP